MVEGGGESWCYGVCMIWGKWVVVVWRAVNTLALNSRSTTLVEEVLST